MHAWTLAWLVANGSPEPAAVTTVELAWAAPAGCGDEAALRRELARYRLDEKPQDARAAVTVSQLDGAAVWSVMLTIELDGARIERRFDAGDCNLAISASALMIAVALDPVGAFDYVDTLEDELAARESAPTEPPPSEPEPAAEREPEPEPGSRVGLIATLAGQASLGPLPAFTGELFGMLGTRLGPGPNRRLAGRVEVTGVFAPARDAPITSRPDAGVRIWFGGAGVRGCAEPTFARVGLAIPICLGVEAGVISGRGFGLDIDRRVKATWFGIPADIGLSFSPGRLVGLAFAVGGFVSGTRPGFVVEGEGLVHRVPAGGFRVRLGLEFRWPDNLGRRRPRSG